MKISIVTFLEGISIKNLYNEKNKNNDLKMSTFRSLSFEIALRGSDIDSFFKGFLIGKIFKASLTSDTFVIFK